LAGLSLNNVNKVYENGVQAVKDLNLEIKDKEFIVLVGPSGCGKSTTLRMIAGLESITSGDIYIGDRKANNVEPKDRDIAMVFQNYALYPHMSVYENMAFGLKLRKIPREMIKEMVLDTARILGIEELLQRKPAQMSGGQKQRVALGRAIIREPQVFLLDEPLSNLDAKLRVQMRAEIIKLHKKLNTTFIYVTHDQTEAMTMGSRIVIMKDGVVQQIDTPKNIYNNPANLFVASFIGSPQMNFMDAEVVAEHEKIKLVFADAVFCLQESNQHLLREKGYIGKSVVLGIRSENVNLSKNNCMVPLTGYVEVVECLGSETYVYINAQTGNVVARMPADFDVSIGDTVDAFFSDSKVYIFDKETGYLI